MSKFNLPEEAVQEFITIWEQEFNEALSLEQGRKEAERWINSYYQVCFE